SKYFPVKYFVVIKFLTNSDINLYQLQRCAPWRTVASQWQTWSILAIAVLLLALVPYVVFRMMTAFDNPPPHSLFKSAAICFGLLSEALLIKCLFSYFSHRLQRAEQSSFSLQPRRSEEHEVHTSLRQCAMAGVKGPDGHFHECVSVDYSACYIWVSTWHSRLRREREAGGRALPPPLQGCLYDSRVLQQGTGTNAK
ncbi:hypothetical protein QQF64_028764, partial [Cirrhinus molitorella]